MKRFLVFILIFQVFIPSFAQSKVISGIVKDKAGEPVPYVSVVLTRDGAIVTGGLTDDNGRFQIKVDAGKYTLTAEFIGCSKETRQVEVMASRLDIGTIVLEESVQSLSEAVVSAKQEAKKSSVEHTTINADASRLIP